jgi:hypothetical protein
MQRAKREIIARPPAEVGEVMSGTAGGVTPLPVRSRWALPPLLEMVSWQLNGAIDGGAKVTVRCAAARTDGACSRRFAAVMFSCTPAAVAGR